LLIFVPYFTEVKGRKEVLTEEMGLNGKSVVIVDFAKGLMVIPEVRHVWNADAITEAVCGVSRAVAGPIQAALSWKRRVTRDTHFGGS